MKHWLVMLFIAGVSAGSAWAQTSDEATLAAVEAYTAGQAAAQKSDWDTAIPALEKALSLNADLFNAHYFLGFAYLAKKDPVKGADHLRAFLAKAEADPGSADKVTRVDRQLGLLLASDKKHAEAIPYLEKALKANPADVDALLQLAVSLTSTGKEEAAEPYWAKVAELDPKRSIAFYHAGRIAYQRKDDENAKKRLDAYVGAVADGPFANKAYFMLGNVAKRANDTEAAKGYFQKYLATNPPAGPQTDAVRQYLESTPAPAETKPSPQ